MSLSVVTFTLGPIENNSYLVADEATGEAIIIDPTFESDTIYTEADNRGWHISALWLTHAHFDHIAGVSLAYRHTTPLPVGLHPADLPLYHQKGGSRQFGFDFEDGPEPSIIFAHGQKLSIGDNSLEVFHTPGHTPGHVVFYSSKAGIAFCGDLIFFHSIGRTDLPGGNQEQLLSSIRSHILTLPETTLLLSGHGIETSVREESHFNPFLGR